MILERVVGKSIRENQRLAEFDSEISISETGKILNIQNESFIERDKPSIMNEISQNIEELMTVLIDKDLCVIEETAHKIKTDCNIIEADEVKMQAFKIELAARRGNIVEVMNNALLIKSEFESYKKTKL